MGGRGVPAHRCSHPGCRKAASADLILSLRIEANRMVKRYNHKDGKIEYRPVKTDSKKTMKHVYLCDEHWPDMYDFLSAYTGTRKEDSE